MSAAARPFRSTGLFTLSSIERDLIDKDKPRLTGIPGGVAAPWMAGAHVLFTLVSTNQIQLAVYDGYEPLHATSHHSHYVTLTLGMRRRPAWAHKLDHHTFCKISTLLAKFGT